MVRCGKQPQRGCVEPGQGADTTPLRLASISHLPEGSTVRATWAARPIVWIQARVWKLVGNGKSEQPQSNTLARRVQFLAWSTHRQPRETLGRAWLAKILSKTLSAFAPPSASDEQTRLRQLKSIGRASGSGNGSFPFFARRAAPRVSTTASRFRVARRVKGQMDATQGQADASLLVLTPDYLATAITAATSWAAPSPPIPISSATRCCR